MTTMCECCGSERIEFEPGFVGAHDEPSRDDTWSCLDCGHVWSRDAWDRLDDRSDEDYERYRDRERGI